jgi:hypothetical protein
MSNSIILTNDTGTVSVDLTKTASITRSLTNPIIIITIPTDKDDTTATGGAVSINLKMLSDMITIGFTLETGIGTHKIDGTGTSYEKLVYLFKYDDQPKKLYWGETAIVDPFPVEMIALSTPTGKGEYLLMQNCSLTLQIVNKLSVLW